MSPVGGLKLELKKAGREDRRPRFARVSVVSPDGREEIKLVTDSHGRLRYRLTPGQYRLRLPYAPDAPFAVGDHGWTPVRLRLP